MARISRQCYESSYFHIMVQGIKKEYIFKDEKMKKYYMKFIREKCDEYGIKIIAYCVMDNHVHLLVYTKELEKLSKLMASVNTKYAKLYNKEYGRVGYVYRDRYRCENIFTERHLYNCIRYIHNNPVEAGICQKPNEYIFSSYNDYVTKKIPADILAQVFGNSSNYMSAINLSNDEINNNYIDIENDFGEGDANEILKAYYLNKKDLTQLSEEQIFFLSKEILKKCRISKSKVAELLKIERTKWYRIMKMYEQ